MHDLLFVNPTALEVADLVRHATTLNLDSQRFQECVNDGKYANEIRKDMAEGQRVGVRGTPTFLMGVSEEEDTKIKALKLIRGARPYMEFKQAIDSLFAPEK